MITETVAAQGLSVLRFQADLFPELDFVRHAGGGIGEEGLAV